MRRMWFIANIASGSADDGKCAAIEALLHTPDSSLAGRTSFPEEVLPTAEALDAAKVDTIILFGGDGTINAALGALAQWNGAFLILPGGTMNLLARELHGDRDIECIIEDARRGARRVALPEIRAGGRRALVGVVLGPAASWFRAREAIRHRRLGRLWRGVRTAWRRTFGEGVRLSGAPGFGAASQAVFVRPVAGGLDAAAIDAQDWRSIAELGWSWVAGDWLSARAVRCRSSSELRLVGRKPALALFDGEPQLLPPGTAIRAGMSRANLLATREVAA